MSKEITYGELEQVNNEILNTDIKGKPYAEVNQRVIAFRKLYPMGTINTHIESLENGVCIVKAEVADETGKLLSTGIAYEKENSTFINKTSYIENCETSAVGRALGFAGIGISASIASAEEVQNAMLNQNPQQKQPQGKDKNNKVDYRLMLLTELKKRNIDINQYAVEKKIHGGTSPERYAELLKELEEQQ